MSVHASKKLSMYKCFCIYLYMILRQLAYSGDLAADPKHCGS